MPSKKTLIFFAVIILLVSSFIFYTYKRGSTENYINTDSLTALKNNTVSQEQEAKDTDGDGLKDWEEVLYGTNPNNPDTDGDGTPDGLEIQHNRNPLIKGPKDSLTPTATKNGSTPTNSDNLTLTDKFAEDFFIKFMNLKQSGVKVTSDNADQIASDYLKSSSLPDIQGKTYKEKDLQLIKTDKNILKTYSDSVTLVMARYWPNNKNNESLILQSAFDTTQDNPINEKTLNGLTGITDNYKKILTQLVSTPVPELAVSFHINILNSLSLYIKTLEMITGAYSDPLSGLAGLNALQTNQTNLIVNIANLRTYLIHSLASL